MVSTYCATVYERSSVGPNVKFTRSDGLMVMLALKLWFQAPASDHLNRAAEFSASRFRPSLFTLTFTLPPPGASADGPPRVRRSSSVRQFRPTFRLTFQ